MGKKHITTKYSTSDKAEVNLELHPKQAQVLKSEATEIFFGGAMGGGKSHLMRVAAIFYCSKIPYLQTYIFRRLSPDLKANHIDGPTGFRAMLEPWVNKGLVEITEDEIRFWNGAKIHLCHCMEEKDMYKYQGCEIHLLLMDELTHFTEKIYRFLRVRTRIAALKDKIPPEFRKKFPLIICASNPCNVGHVWVKRTFVDYAIPETIVKTPKSEGGRLRQFIPSTIVDNPSMEESYADTLSGIGDESLVRAYRYGDWDVLSGSYFSNFSRNTHVLKPFPIPRHWQRLVGLDWGWYYPFSVTWWALSPEDYEDPLSKQFIPAGSLVCYREWYGSEGNNVGVKMPPDLVASKMREFEAGEPEPFARIADPEMWGTNQGLSVADIFTRCGMYWKKGNNKDRVRGWNEMEARINAKPYPTMYWFENCIDSIRVIPSLVRDEKKPEDVDKNCEQHPADSARYVAMFVTIGLPRKEKDIILDTKITYHDLHVAHKRAMAKKKRAYNSLII